GIFGTQLGDRMSQEGWEDPNAASTQAAQIENEVFGRDKSGDVIVMVNNPQENLAEGREYVDKLKAPTRKKLPRSIVISIPKIRICSTTPAIPLSSPLVSPAMKNRHSKTSAPSKMR